MKSFRTPALRATALAVAAFVSINPYGRAQDAPATTADTTGAVHDLQDQVRALRTMVDEMRAENAQSRAEMQ